MNTIECECKNCGQNFLKLKKRFKSSPINHFCGNKCCIEYRKKHEKPKRFISKRRQEGPSIQKICPNCSKIYSIKYSHQNRPANCCSQQCSKEHKRNLLTPETIFLYTIKKMGANQIARQFKVGTRIIFDILKNNNIKIRDKSWHLRENPPCKGTKHSPERIEKHKLMIKEMYENDPSLRDRAREKTLQQLRDGKMPQSNTSIEKIIANLLLGLGLSFEYQKIFAYWCFDFYLPKYDLFIECDGDYWHAHPEIYGINKKPLNDIQRKVAKRDKAKETYLRNRNHYLIRFWEKDIHNQPEEVKERLLQKINNIEILQK